MLALFFAQQSEMDEGIADRQPGREKQPDCCSSRDKISKKKKVMHEEQPIKFFFFFVGQLNAAFVKSDAQSLHHKTETISNSSVQQL